GGQAARRMAQGYPQLRMADIPSGRELQLNSRAAYDRVANNPMLYHPLTMRDYIDRTMVELSQPGQHGTPHIRENSPEFYALMDRWFNNNAANRAHPVTAAEWMSLRDQLQSLPYGPSGVAGSKAVDRLERYIYNPPKGAIVQGTAGDLGALRSD